MACAQIADSQMKALVVGAGGTARELLGSLADHWDITVVDLDVERLERIHKVREVETVAGDGSSRVVLERAGLTEADAVIAASDDDDVNLEVCRLALAVSTSRIAAVARDPERLDDYRALKVPVFSRARLTARRIEMQVEPRRVTTAVFAEGLAEAIEFRITPDAPVVNRPLSDLASDRWLVAAVLRGGSLIVPHGDTVLRPDDLVTVVGAASDYAAIVDLFTSGQARFPLDVGHKVIVVCENEAQVRRHVAEAAAFVHASAAESLLVIHDDPTSTSDAARRREIDAILRSVAGLSRGFDVRTRASPAPTKDLPRVALEEGAGVIVLPSVSATDHAHATRPSHAAALLRTTGVPVLLARDSHPYQRVLVPARDTPSGMAATRAAIDLGALGTMGLRGIAVVPPDYLAGTDSRDSAVDAIARFREDAAVHGLTIEGKVVEGNPIRQIVAEAAGVDLLIVGVGRRSRSARAFARHLAKRTPVSMLMVPERPTDAS